MIDFGSFSLNKALLPVGAFDAVGQLMPQLAPAIGSFAGQNPANLLLDGKSTVSIGYNLGVMVNVSKKITLGASYRSKVNLSVEGGDAKVAYANEYAKTVITALSAQQQALKMFSVLDGATFDASLPIPYILSFGAAYKPTEKWTLTADYQISGWSAYKSLDIVFDETTGGYTSSSVKNYKNSWALRIGAQWDATKFASFRIGGYVDTPPVQMDNYSPETPSATAGCFTFGATLRPAKFLSIDLALAYLSGVKTNGTITEGTSIFGGVYQKSAIMPSFGVRFQL
jgi:long-chain fatty acid transport protein